MPARTASIRTILSIESASSAASNGSDRSNGSRSTVFVPPLGSWRILRVRAGWMRGVDGRGRGQKQQTTSLRRTLRVYVEAGRSGKRAKLETDSRASFLTDREADTCSCFKSAYYPVKTSPLKTQRTENVAGYPNPSANHRQTKPEATSATTPIDRRSSPPSTSTPASRRTTSPASKSRLPSSSS
ncbi:hypothetical protein B0H13DRAFT_138785 [Mycena leptocephala]|nr:hypothetical protein B0H13DRAFT_138785 [Mycena leptocephala]